MAIRVATLPSHTGGLIFIGDYGGIDKSFSLTGAGDQEVLYKAFLLSCVEITLSTSVFDCVLMHESARVMTGCAENQQVRDAHASLHVKEDGRNSIDICCFRRVHVKAGGCTVLVGRYV